MKRWGRARRHEEVLAADAAREEAGAMVAGRTSKCCRPTAAPPSPADRPTHRLPTKPSARARSRGSVARAAPAVRAPTTRSESRPRRPVGSRRRGGEVAEADARPPARRDAPRWQAKKCQISPPPKFPPAACSRQGRQLQPTHQGKPTRAHANGSVVLPVSNCGVRAKASWSPNNSLLPRQAENSYGATSGQLAKPAGKLLISPTRPGVWPRVEPLRGHGRLVQQAERPRVQAGEVQGHQGNQEAERRRAGPRDAGRAEKGHTQ